MDKELRGLLERIAVALEQLTPGALAATAEAVRLERIQSMARDALLVHKARMESGRPHSNTTLQPGGVTYVDWSER